MKVFDNTFDSANTPSTHLRNSNDLVCRNTVIVVDFNRYF